MGLEPVRGRRPEVTAVQIILLPALAMLELDDVVALSPGWKFNTIFGNPANEIVLKWALERR